MIYGMTQGDSLTLLGQAWRDDNYLRLRWDESAAEQLAGGELRRFVFVRTGTTRKLLQPPLIPVDLLRKEPESKVFAEILAKPLSHRVVSWVGWPLEGRDLLVMKPRATLARHGELSRKQQGFIDRVIANKKPPIDEAVLRQDPDTATEWVWDGEATPRDSAPKRKAARSILDL